MRYYEYCPDIFIQKWVSGTLDTNPEYGHYVERMLNLHDYPEAWGMTNLPDNLEISGYLLVTMTTIKELPSKLWVGGDLYLPQGMVVPENTIVLGSIVFQSANRKCFCGRESSSEEVRCGRCIENGFYLGRQEPWWQKQYWQK